MTPRIRSPHLKQPAQVAIATLLIAGTPVAAVWWLRASGLVGSAVLTLVLGMVVSLLLSSLGRAFWEKRQGSDDLLFSELMVWGYIHRLHTERRIASTAELAAPLSAGAADAGAVRAATRMLERLVSSVETRDPYLHGHSRRVARHASMIARRMKLPAEEAARVRTAAALHDVGKTRTPKSILHKAGRLTDEEYELIKLHPGDGAQMASTLGDPQLVGMIRHHHERADGSGYPDGLRGEEIPLGARIIAVADTFDAITSTRPYRAASPHKKAIDILRAEAGAKLDPGVVRAFCGHYAGRGPLALWSFLCSLPERLLSWLTASAATVASAAKVVAIAALVGGVAATSSTLGLTGTSHASTARRAHGAATATAISPTAAARGAGALILAPSTSSEHARGPARRQVALNGRAGTSGRSLHTDGSAAPVVGGGGGSQSAGSGERVAAREEPGSHGEAPPAEQPHRTTATEPSPVHEEAPSKGKHEEAPPKPAHEEHVATVKHEEAPGAVKHEEPAPKPVHEEAAGGKPEEKPGKGPAVKGAAKGEGEPGGNGAGG